MKRLFQVYLLGLILFLCARFLFFFKLEFEVTGKSYWSDLLKAFWIGARFDTMVLFYGFLLPFLFAFFGLFTNHDFYHSFIRRFTRVYLHIMLILFFIFLVVDVFYYNYFQSHINILIFGFIEDDTVAVMQSIWTDYPFLKVMFALLVFSWLIGFLLNKIYSQSQTTFNEISVAKGLPVFLITIAFFLLGMRGSVGTFPLQIDDATVSENTSINLLPMNGVFALKEAWLSRKKQMNLDGNIAWLENIGYSSAQTAIGDYYGIKPENTDPASLQELYFAKANRNDSVKLKTPNVIFFMMESMSNYNIGLHSPSLNLLGALEKYWNTEILFQKCLPFGNGTINSLEGLLVNTPVTSLAQSDNRYISFNSSVAIPFKNAGYQTRYVTGGKLGWRNINEFIPNQHFDFVEGNANIQSAIPETQQCEWGVYDEYLFDYVFKILKESKGIPQMIFAMTTTNHTPFNLPAHYKPYPVAIPASLKGRLQTDEKMAVRNLTNLQYSNDCLGRFLDKIKASPFAENTIVVATGDHNNLMLFAFSDDQILQKRGVPLLMYLPESQKKYCRIDTSIFVSHKDIFPTLINLALPGQRYFNGGNNLFDSSIKPGDYFSIDLMSKDAISDAGAVQFDPVASFFFWDENKRLLTKTSAPTADLNNLLKKSRAYYASMSYFIKNEIELHKNKRK